MFVPCRFQTSSCGPMFKYHLFNKVDLTILSETAAYPTLRSFSLNPIFSPQHLPPSNILCNLFIQHVYCLLSDFSSYDVNFMRAGMFACFISWCKPPSSRLPGEIFVEWKNCGLSEYIYLKRDSHCWIFKNSENENHLAVRIIIA